MDTRAIGSTLVRAFGVALALASESASATSFRLTDFEALAVITFNGTAAEGGETPFFPNTVHTEAGYTITHDAGNIVFVDNNDQRNAFPGLVNFFDDDVLAFNQSTGVQFTLTNVGGRTFTLLSVMTGSLGRNALDDGFFTFTGNLSGGGTVSTTIAGASPPQTFSFSGFTNLTSIVVTSTDGAFPVMDNITLADAPEPATLVLLGLGLLGLGATRRRHSHHAFIASESACRSRSV